MKRFFCDRCHYEIVRDGTSGAVFGDGNETEFVTGGGATKFGVTVRTSGTRDLCRGCVVAVIRNEGDPIAEEPSR